MSLTQVVGKGFVFGIPQLAVRIKDLPSGAKVRLRLRIGEYALARVRTAEGIAEHYLRADGDVYLLGPRRGENRRIPLGP